MMLVQNATCRITTPSIPSALDPPTAYIPRIENAHTLQSSLSPLALTLSASYPQFSHSFFLVFAMGPSLA